MSARPTSSSTARSIEAVTPALWPGRRRDAPDATPTVVNPVRRVGRSPRREAVQTAHGQRPRLASRAISEVVVVVGAPAEHDGVEDPAVADDVDPVRVGGGLHRG